MSKELARKIKAAKKRLQDLNEEKPGELPHLDRRVELLDQLLVEEEYENCLEEPIIFLSFAGAEGEEILPFIKGSLRKLNVPGKAKTTFAVKTGMDLHGNRHVLNFIADQVHASCIFVGILSKEHALAVEDGEGGGYAPGAWALLEAGIAQGFGLEVILFIEMGVHESFWKDAFGYSRQARFDRENPKPGLNLLCELVLQAYRELRKKRR